MHAGTAYAEALEEARALGFAEADPHFDVSGQDAAFKLVLIALAAFTEAPSVLALRGH